VILLAALFLAQDVEVEIRAAAVRPKFRLRDGEKSLKGESVFSDELDADGDTFSPGGSVAVRWGAERFHAELWSLTAEGSSVLEEPKAWGGGVLPAGTPTDADVRFDQLEIGWRHRFEVWGTQILRADDCVYEPILWLEAGLDLERMVVDADLGFGSTRLGGVFLTPQVSVTAAPWPWFEVSAGAGGFFLPFRSGDTSVLDPLELGFEVKGRWDRFSVGVGYELFHLHLEEESGRAEEDVVHLRLRGVVLSAEVRF